MTQYLPILLLAAAAALAWAVLKQRRERQRRAAVEERRNRLLKGANRADPYIDKVVGGFLIVQKLGSGGMATVYRAVPAGQLDGEPVAVKLIKPDLQDKDFRERFLREIRVSASLDHPHVVRVLDYGEHDGLPFLVMELVEGHQLKVPEQGLPPADVLRLLDPLAQALGYAHSRGIVHRDLKPDNIIVGGRQLKLMDFGIARSREVQTVTMTGCAVGTPAYMAPEQVTGGGLDPRSDQYSLGVLLYEMLAGRRPFEASDAMSLLLQHLSDTPPTLEIENAAVASVVARMLSKAPEARFPTVLEAWAAFRRAIDDPTAVVALPTAAPPQARKEVTAPPEGWSGHDTLV